MPRIHIGLGSCCIAKGSDQLYQALQKSVAQVGAAVEVKRVGCVGMCHRTPLVEVVVPGGNVMRTGGRTIKNVSGYDLTQLIVGSEGTLGVVTEITLQLIPKPMAQATALVAFARLPDACEAVGMVLACGITPLVTELMDHGVMCAIADLQQSRSRPPAFSLEAEALLLVAVDGDRDADERDIEVIAGVLRQSGATQVQRARTDEEAEELWEIRRSVSPAVIRLGNSRFGEDIVVPRGQIPPMVERVKQIAKKYDLTIAVFGHVGDGNLHPNIICDRRDAEMMKRVEAASHAIFDAALDLGGAISGEHGIGSLKTGYVPKSVDPLALQLMREIKWLFDPHNIMNPGKKIVETGLRTAGW